tara:strand:+ start:415 stop:1092 length:678 start_codon:yes stop_codon:yes gene_type:complete
MRLHPITLFCIFPFFLTADEIEVNEPKEFIVGIKGAVSLSFQTEASKIYQIQFSVDLENWDNEGYSFLGTGGLIERKVSTRGLASGFFIVRDSGDAGNLQPLGSRFYNQLVYSGPLVSVWSILDLSALLGTGQKICLLEITKISGAEPFDIKFLPNGSEYPTPAWEYGTGFYAFGVGAGTFTNAGKENSPLRLQLISTTGVDGKLIWQTNGSGSTQIEIKIIAVL